MQFGLYVTQPNALAGSPEIARSRDQALSPLNPGIVDEQFALGQDVLLEADHLGFDIILFAERHQGPDIAAWVMASAIGAQTKRLRSMVAVHPGLWHPAMIAKLAASLDRVCPGRSAINVVTGWNEREFRMYGGEVLLDSDARRYARAHEFIEVLRGLWCKTPFSFSGEFYKIEDSELLLKPATAHAPEIFTAARSEEGLEMVARTADWWFVDYPKTVKDATEVEASLKSKMADMTNRADRYGRKVRFAFNPFVAFGKSEETATEETLKRLMQFEPGSDTRLMRSRLGPPMKAGGLGPPSLVLDQMKRYRDLGIELLLLRLFPPLPMFVG